MYIDPAALILILLIAGGIGMALAGAAFALRFINRRIDELEAVLAKRRHTYATSAGLEDATAVAIDALFDEEEHAEYRRARLDQLRRILGEIREGPLAYNAERPSERPPRPDGRSKR